MVKVVVIMSGLKILSEFKKLKEIEELNFQQNTFSENEQRQEYLREFAIFSEKSFT